MQRIVLTLLLACFAIWPVAATADNTGALLHAFKNTPGAVSAVDVVDLPDGAEVVMVGRVETLVGGTLYKFADYAGVTTVNIDYAYQSVLNDFSTNDILKVSGVVQRNFDDFAVLVNKIEKLD